MEILFELSWLLMFHWEELVVFVMPAQNKHSSSCAKCRTVNSLAYKPTRAQQIPNKSIHHLINSTTCKLINPSPHHLSNLQAHQLINSKTFQLINLSTYRLGNSSPRQLKNTLTRHLINLQTHHLTTFPTCKLINSLTQKLSNLSTYQPID